MSEFQPQDLANTAWAFATVNHRDEKIFITLARAAERHVSEFKAQEHAITAWAFATLTHQDEKLFTILARAAERQVWKLY